MAELSGVKTLPQIVEEYIFLTKKPMDEYTRYMQLAINGFKEAKLFHLKGFAKIVKMTVSDIKTIDLSTLTDYISFIAVGVPLNGEYWWLTERDAICFTQTGTTLDSDDGEGVDVNDSYFFGYQASGGVNREGYFKIDEANRRIVLNKLQSTRTEVFLLYVSTGVNAGEATYVPERVKNMLFSYINWKDKLFTDQNPNLMAMAKDDYFGEVDKLRYLETPSIQEFRDALMSVTNQLSDR